MKISKKAYDELMARVQKSERKAKILDDLVLALVEALQGEIECIAQSEAEAIVGDLQIST